MPLPMITLFALSALPKTIGSTSIMFVILLALLCHVQVEKENAILIMIFSAPLSAKTAKTNSNSLCKMLAINMLPEERLLAPFQNITTRRKDHAITIACAMAKENVSTLICRLELVTAMDKLEMMMTLFLPRIEN